MAFLERVRRLLPGLWAGFLVCIALVAAPAAFSVLERAEAGKFVNKLFAQEAYVSLLLGILILVLERWRAKRQATAGQGAQFSGGMMLALGTVFCTVLGYFALQPMLPGAKLGQGPFSFGQLHAASAAFFLVKMVLALALAWLALKPAAARA